MPRYTNPIPGRAYAQKHVIRYCVNCNKRLVWRQTKYCCKTCQKQHASVWKKEKQNANNE